MFTNENYPLYSMTTMYTLFIRFLTLSRFSDSLLLAETSFVPPLLSRDPPLLSCDPPLLSRDPALLSCDTERVSTASSACRNCTRVLGTCKPRVETNYLQQFFALSKYRIPYSYNVCNRYNYNNYK